MGIRPPLFVIAGPTASGKSQLAIQIAEQIGGVIVNADSAQIYRDLPVLSAAPTAEDQARAEHRLYGVQDGALPCSAADWAAMARQAVAEIHAQQQAPILTGGTGLYLRTLIDGIAPVPPIDPEVRARVRATPVGDNFTQLQAVDAEAATRLRPTDSLRVARALEVRLSTGRPIAQWQQERTGGIADEVEIKPLVLLPPREWLYERCDQRFAGMFDRASAEVQALLERRLSPDVPVMRAIGVAEVGAFLRGEMSSGQAIAAGQQATRRYAKRQYTWFSRQPPAEWPRFTEPLEGKRLAEALAMVTPSG